MRNRYGSSLLLLVPGNEQQPQPGNHEHVCDINDQVRSEAVEVSRPVAGLENLRGDHVTCGPAHESNRHCDSLLCLSSHVTGDE